MPNEAQVKHHGRKHNLHRTKTSDGLRSGRHDCTKGQKIRSNTHGKGKSNQ